MISEATEYFQNLGERADWSSLLAQDMTFTSFTNPSKRVNGRAAYLGATKRLYASVQSVALTDLFSDGSKACALTHYKLRGPNGDFESDFAEVFEIRDGRIFSFGISFDTARVPKWWSAFRAPKLTPARGALPAQERA